MQDDRQPDARALLEAALISLFILALFYLWFALADRYAIFLYGHSATGITLTQPFDTVTSSRYWMAGLVTAGLVMVVYTIANWIGGRIAAQRGVPFGTPPWRQVWGLAALPLAVGIPAITMTVNTPTLPLPLAAASAAATLVGLAIALMPGRWAADRPRDLLWLAADGLGLVPVLMLLRAVELPGQGLSVSSAVVSLAAIGSVVSGAVWLALMSFLRRWRRKDTPGAATIFLSGVGLSYLLLPLGHYLTAGPPGFRYITNSANFFANNPMLQLLAFAAAAGLAIGAVWFRKWLPHRYNGREMKPAPVFRVE